MPVQRQGSALRVLARPCMGSRGIQSGRLVCGMARTFLTRPRAHGSVVDTKLRRGGCSVFMNAARCTRNLKTPQCRSLPQSTVTNRCFYVSRYNFNKHRRHTEAVDSRCSTGSGHLATRRLFGSAWHRSSLNFRSRHLSMLNSTCTRMSNFLQGASNTAWWISARFFTSCSNAVARACTWSAGRWANNYCEVVHQVQPG